MEQDARTVRVEELLAHREWVARISRALVADDAPARDLEQDLYISVLPKTQKKKPTPKPVFFFLGIFIFSPHLA